MLLELRYIFTYVRGLMAHTDETWELLSKGEVKESKPDFMMAHYYWPLFGISAVFVLLLIGCGGLFGEGVRAFELERGMKAMVEFVVVYAVGPMLISLLIDPIFRYMTTQSMKREKVDVFVHYTMSALMVLEVCCAVFPNLEFLGFSKLYIIYIIAVGVDKYLNIKGREVPASTVLWAFVFYIAPIIIRFLIHFFERL